ncbi:MAG: oxygenase MpaB family protein [Pseudonocardia sp.]
MTDHPAETGHSAETGHRTATDHAPETGYFGPGSVSRRVIADPAAGVGGIRALFLQALHPRAMAGVAQHSNFAADFWPRLQRTAQYVTTVAFGSTEQADAAAARVRAVHRQVRGVDQVTGLPYAADDPDLLRWVHVTEVSSFLDAVRRAGLRLTDAEADEFYAEQVTAAALVGATDVPASRAEVAEYLRAVRPELRASRVAREAALRLALPPMPMRVQLFTPARPAWAVVAGVAYGLLPGWARQCYRLPGPPGTELAATVALRGLRAAALVLPPSVRPRRR